MSTTFMSNAITITVPREYGYVLLTAASSFLLAIWHGFRASPFRKAAGVLHPNPYALNAPKDATGASASPKAKEEYLFNCAQRAHANFIENQPSFTPALLVAGLKYPVASSVLGVGWCVCRLLYAVGYTNPNKVEGKGRGIGGGFFFCQLGLILMAAKVGVDLVMGW